MKPIQNRNVEQTGSNPRIPLQLDKFIGRTLGQKVRAGCTELQLRKFQAALLMLAYTRRRFPLKEIAKIVGVSELQIRNWRAQDKFKKQVNEFSKQYAEEFVATLGKSPSFSEKPFVILTKEFLYYSGELCIEITDSLKDRVENTGQLFGFGSKQLIIALASFACAMHLWTIKLNKSTDKKEGLSFLRTRYELNRLNNQYLRSAHKAAIKTKNYQLAQELFDSLAKTLDQQMGNLYNLEKSVI